MDQKTSSPFPLDALEMIGAYALSHEAVDEALTRTSPGNYALGYMVDGTFMVSYVGRSDGDLREELHAWVGAPSRFERYGSGARAGWGAFRSFSAGDCRALPRSA